MKPLLTEERQYEKIVHLLNYFNRSPSLLDYKEFRTIVLDYIDNPELLYKGNMKTLNLGMFQYLKNTKKEMNKMKLQVAEAKLVVKKMEIRHKQQLDDIRKLNRDYQVRFQHEKDNVEKLRKQVEELKEEVEKYKFKLIYGEGNNNECI